MIISWFSGQSVTVALRMQVALSLPSHAGPGIKGLSLEPGRNSDVHDLLGR